MEYEMRKLQATDIFSVVKILNGIGLKNIKEAIDFEEINKIRKGMTGSLNNKTGGFLM